MFPLYDSTPRKTFPWVNYLIIIVNIYFFWLEITAPNSDLFIQQHSFIPANFNLIKPVTYIPIFESLFIHGSVLHILTNMWFLHIFGDNVEDRLGHLKYLLFYLLGGLIAALSQYILAPSTTIPMVGASGAISAVAGTYFVLYRNSTVKCLLFIFIIVTFVNVPVWLFLGYWFVVQIFSGIGSLTTMALQDGGVAWFAHVGGFIFGYLVAKALKTEPAVEEGEIIS